MGMSIFIYKEEGEEELEYIHIHNLYKNESFL